MKNKIALITGINGMDGSHLADLLLSKNYKVYGVERRSSTKNRTNILHLEDKITFLQGDLTDQNSLLRCIKESNPDEVYNLAAQSFVGESWNTPEHTSEVTGLGVLRMLEAIREYNPKIKFYQASSSEMFGRMVENPAKETTPFYPRIIENHTVCLLVVVFYLTMNLKEEVLNLLQERLLMEWLELS